MLMTSLAGVTNDRISSNARHNHQVHAMTDCPITKCPNPYCDKGRIYYPGDPENDTLAHVESCPVCKGNGWLINKTAPRIAPKNAPGAIKTGAIKPCAGCDVTCECEGQRIDEHTAARPQT